MMIHAAKLFLLLAMLSCGCSLLPHGPAVAVVSTQDVVLYGADPFVEFPGEREWDFPSPGQASMGVEVELRKDTVRKTRYRDAWGLRWTESEVISSEPVPGGLPALEAEMFATAQGQTPQKTGIARVP